ncbi:MAG: response regulator [Chthoniobacteraceae bacterium]
MTEEQLRQSRILVVDDDLSTLCLIKSVLDRLGFRRIVAFQHSREFMQRFQSVQPELVITDLLMPEVDGFEVIQYLREIEPNPVALPAIVLTASGSAESRRRSLAAGATDILIKPFDPSELLMRIRNALRTRFLHLALSEQNASLEQIVAARTSALECALSELKDSQRAIVQQARFRAFGEMASGVVHDFNNALMTVIGYSELLLGDPLAIADTEQVRDYLTTINTAGRDASHVVSRLRDFYRPRDKDDPFEPVDLNKIIEEAVKLTQPKWRVQAQSKGIQVQVQYQLERVPPMFGNPSELREAMMNLIFNAVDSMTTGGQITLRSRQDGARVQCEVEDTGQGMSADVRQRCLEPFFTTKGESGTGLGLPMVFGVITRHDGQLDIDSVVGRGTNMILSFPVHDPVGASSSTIVIPAAPLRPLKVLVVDDELSSRDIVSRYLASDGHDVTTVETGMEAVWQFEHSRFDLLLTDHTMPGMNGIELAQVLRQMRMNQPIILLTGFVFDAKTLPSGISCVVRKPVAPERLRAALASVMGK